MPIGQKVVVIGAGVIGLNIAWRLAECGAAVTIVEATSPGAGTSSTSFAWVNASSKFDAAPAYFELNARGLREHIALSGQNGDAPWAHFTGEIEIAPTAVEAEALARKVARLTATGYAAEMLSRERLEALEPGTVLPTGGAAAAYPEEGWVEVEAFVAALTARCRAAGVTMIAADPATTIIRKGGRLSAVRLTSGATIEADVAIIAIGRWTGAFAASLGLTIPLVAPDPLGSKAVGLLVRVRPAGALPRRVLHSPTINWSPLPGGRAHLASDPCDAAVARDRSPETISAATDELLRQAAALNPLFQGATLDDARIGLRALPADGVTICGWTRAIPGLYVAVTHSGVTLSPLLGALVAQEVVEGRESAMLASFRPDRFGG